MPKDCQDRIVIKVLKTRKLVEECREASAYSPQFRESWIIFDRDQVPNFDEIIEEAKADDIHVGWSNPCIEIWFDAYFGKMHPYMDSVSCCSGFAHTFKQKTGKEYKKANLQIYQNLVEFGDEAEAIKIANNRYGQFLKDNDKKPSDMCPCTTVQELIGEIRDKTKK